jgi:glutathione peroxidase
MSILSNPYTTSGRDLAVGLRRRPSSLSTSRSAVYAAVHRARALRYADKGFTVVGFPCNQFGGQEPGSAEEIESFCSTTYGVTFPMMEKIDVNGDGRHPIYSELTEVADAEGHSGDIRWNFEKFLIAPDGSVTRFSPMVTPEDPALVGAIEASLPG